MKAKICAAALVSVALLGSAARAQTIAKTMQAGGRERSFLIHVPAGYDGRTPVALVLVLHGGSQSPSGAERMSGMSVKADQEGFIAVYPSGTSAFGRAPTWNSGACCAYAQRKNVDDVGFLRALVAKLEKEYRIDPRRVFMTGISNGGMMSYRAACEMSDVVATVAPVEGAQDLECRPSAPVSVIVFHGTADRMVPFEGGSTPYQIGSVRSDTPVRDTVSFWVKRDGCSPKPKHEEQKEVHIDTYSGCKDSTAVVLYAIQGGRHMWPGSAHSGNHVAATDLMWTFFQQHPKP